MFGIGSPEAKHEPDRNSNTGKPSDSGARAGDIAGGELNVLGNSSPFLLSNGLSWFLMMHSGSGIYLPTGLHGAIWHLCDRLSGRQRGDQFHATVRTMGTG